MTSVKVGLMKPWDFSPSSWRDHLGKPPPVDYPLLECTSFAIKERTSTKFPILRSLLPMSNTGTRWESLPHWGNISQSMSSQSTNRLTSWRCSGSMRNNLKFRVVYYLPRTLLKSKVSHSFESHSTKLGRTSAAYHKSTGLWFLPYHTKWRRLFSTRQSQPWSILSSVGILLNAMHPWNDWTESTTFNWIVLFVFCTRFNRIVDSSCHDEWDKASCHSSQQLTLQNSRINIWGAYSIQ